MRCFHGVAFVLALPAVAGQVFFKPNPIPDNYIEWTATLYMDSEGTSSYSASTDESVVFWWEAGSQDVWAMHDETAWKNCDFSYAVRLVEPVTSGGNYIEGEVDLGALPAGTHYLACGVGTHCDAGQKLILTTWKDDYANEATGWNAFVGSGASNAALGDWSTVGGGYNNRATGMSSTVIGGISNYAISNYASIAGGYRNVARSRFATVMGGAKNTAGGRFTVTAGYMAKTTQDYAAAFGFSGELCETTTAKTVGFCAKSFYLNDHNLLDARRARQLQDDTLAEQKSALEVMSDTVDNHQQQLDHLLEADGLQQEALKVLDRIEGKVAALLQRS